MPEAAAATVEPKVIEDVPLTYIFVWGEYASALDAIFHLLEFQLKNAILSGEDSLVNANITCIAVWEPTPKASIPTLKGLSGSMPKSARFSV